MHIKLTGRVATFVAMLGIVAVLFPEQTRAELSNQTVPTVEPIAILGVTPPKKLSFVPMSVRNPAFPQKLIRDATGDTYDAAGLLRDPTSAWFLNESPDNHTFGTGEESAGLNLLSGVDTRIVGTDMGPGFPCTNLLQVNYFTVDSSDLVPVGSVSPAGLPFDAWRLDVGTTAAGVDKINWLPNPGFTVVTSGICLFQDGAQLACFELALHDSDANGVSGVGLVGLVDGADIAGIGVDEMVMFWEIQLEDPMPADLDDDDDVDLRDAQIFLNALTGPNPP